MKLLPYNPQTFLRIFRFGLLRFRSPLLTEYLFVYFPPGTEMFYFPGFASFACAQDSRRSERVSPFGDLRIKGC